MSAFSIPIAALAERMKEDLDTAVRKATLRLFRSVVLRTPVDTGRARANWNVSFGAADYSVTVSTNQARGLAEAEKALALPVGGITYISNGLPYIRLLEHGYSRQAPQGMVRLAAAEFARAVQAATR